MRRVVKAIHKLAPTDATVLIQGETGVGKELIAKAIHALSSRAHRPFIAVNCGAIPETLIESTLFGHEKGAFTGAIDIHQGVFERAEGGTLFLDEVDSLSPAAQVRLLRALQEGEIERVGGKRTLTVDVRILAATNQDLGELVRTGAFREDLFYRIHVVKLSIPPLRERQEDLPALVQLILQRLSKKYRRPITGVSRSVMEQIRYHPWPGNVRELENTLERSFLFADGPELTQLDLAIPGDFSSPDWRRLKHQILAEEEKRCLIDALRNHRGNIDAVAKAMGLTPRSIYLKLKRHGLSASVYRS
jgi:two-component system response regulator HydG